MVARILRRILVTLYTRKWFPLQGELAPLTYAVFSKAILIRSMLAAGVVQDTFVGEAVEGKGGEEETTGGYFLVLLLLVLLPLRLKSLPFLSS